MWEAVCYAGTGGAARVLNLAGWKRRLGAFRLPKYSEIHTRLVEMEERAHVLGLWGAVFRDAAPRERYVFDLQCAFVLRVDRELFPIDLRVLDEWYNGGEEQILYCPVTYQRWGLPCEVCAIGDLAGYAQPVVGALAQALEFSYDEEDSLLWQDLWWDEVGQTAPRWDIPLGREGLDVLQEGLRCLDMPMRALADVVDCVRKETGNPFLDRVPCFWATEYDEDVFYWEPSYIRLLSRLYEGARPAIERMRAYEDWYNRTGDAGAQVLALLGKLVGGGWEIRDGEVIFYE